VLQIKGSLKHAKLLIEKTYDEVEALPAGTKANTGFGLTVLAGQLGISELKSLLSALKEATAKFQEGLPMQFNLNIEIVNDVQDSFLANIESALATAQKLEASQKIVSLDEVSKQQAGAAG
jgi:hypothetical protein